MISEVQAVLLLIKSYLYEGGEGSGNFGHAGRPGEVGGSAPEGEGGSGVGGSGEEGKKVSDSVLKAARDEVTPLKNRIDKVVGQEGELKVYDQESATIFYKTENGTVLGKIPLS